MPPHEGLVHMKEYDWRDSNVENVGSELDHKVKYNSAATEPAWDGVGEAAGLRIWRIEDFEVVAWPEERYGDFHEGDSYIVLHSYKVGGDGEQEQERLAHDVFFWLGSQTTQDEAGVAAYKTVELDERLGGVAVQHRELQRSPSEDFVALFPHLRILSGGVRTGFRHVEAGSAESDKDATDRPPLLLRVFKDPGVGRRDGVVVHEVPATWRSLDDGDVFVLEREAKIWVWQGRGASPMERARGAQVVADLTRAKHLDVEVLSQADDAGRARAVVAMLGAEGGELDGPFEAPRPIGVASSSSSSAAAAAAAAPAADDSGSGSGGAQRRRRSPRLFRLSDASGQLRFDVVREGGDSLGMRPADLDSADVFLLDTGAAVWVWQGRGASRAERAMWIRVAESYLRQQLDGGGDEGAHRCPISKVLEGHESKAFVRALGA